MSNKKVRLQIEAMEAKNKFLEDYKKKSDFILNFQMCKAYFSDSALSVNAVVEKILKPKFSLPWQLKLLKSAIDNTKGSAKMDIPQMKFSKSKQDVLAEFVIKNFERFVMDYKSKSSLYPLKFRDILKE